MRYREIEADFSSSHGDIVVQTQHHHLERSAFKLYTKTIFRLFRKVLERACRFDVHTISQNGSIHNHIVRRYPRQDIEWTVSYCEHRLVFECTCKRLETLGIACERVMCVVKFLGIVNLPDCLVLPRWTKSAKDVVNVSNANSSSQRNPAFITSYVIFVERCKRMGNAALCCGKPELLRGCIEIVETQTRLLEAVGRGEDVSQNELGTQTEGSLGNPPLVRRKGGGGASSSLLGTGRSKRRGNKCGICGVLGHNRQSCHIQSESLLQSQSLYMESFNYGDDYLDEDDDGCNIYMGVD